MVTNKVNAETLPKDEMQFSFVIPCLNEEHSISRTIQNINENTPKNVKYQIIVVDNGSTDQTVGLARELGAIVIIEPDISIAELRNVGADRAEGAVLVFIDADISLTPQWGVKIQELHHEIVCSSRIYGSKCLPVGDEGILDSHWFYPISLRSQNKYVGTGHMIISKEGFEKIGGFDKNLKTGEDYDFCQRAANDGFIIENVPQLKVIHHGFPKSICQFVEREAWHGKGDLQNFSSAISSKVVLAAFSFLVANIALILAAISGSFSSFMISLGIATSIPLFLSIYKFPRIKLKFRILNIFLCAAYLYGRIMSIFYAKKKWR
jgi:glycosyltransferase involved in cell wall biosynthesis